MMAHRASILLAASAPLLLMPVQAAAQANSDPMRECAKIGDPTARLACYDSIQPVDSAPQPQAVAPSPLPQQGSAAPAAAPAAPTGFGSETVRAPAPQRQASAAQRVDSIQARVTGVVQREPGVYRIDLDDGAQWIFNQSVDRFYRVPNPGSTVEIERASLGSFVLRFDDQKPVRVRRLQ